MNSPIPRFKLQAHVMVSKDASKRKVSLKHKLMKLLILCIRITIFIVKADLNFREPSKQVCLCSLFHFSLDQAQCLIIAFDVWWGMGGGGGGGGVFTKGSYEKGYSQQRMPCSDLCFELGVLVDYVIKQFSMQSRNYLTTAFCRSYISQNVWE